MMELDHSEERYRNEESGLEELKDSLGRKDDPTTTGDDDWGYFSAGFSSENDESENEDNSEMNSIINGGADLRKKLNNHTDRGEGLVPGMKQNNRSGGGLHTQSGGTRKRKKSKMFASSRFGASCVCRHAVRYPASCAATVKNVNCTLAKEQEPTVIACEETESLQHDTNYQFRGHFRTISLVSSEPRLNEIILQNNQQDVCTVDTQENFLTAHCVSTTSTNTDKEKKEEHHVVATKFLNTPRGTIINTNHERQKQSLNEDDTYKEEYSTQESSSLSKNNNSTSSKSTQIKHKFATRRGLRIEARVRKRRDDFCGDAARGGRSARWDVERWHVFAPTLVRDREIEYQPDHDGLILSPAFAPRVATRFFERGQDMMSGLTVSLAMGSIRVVSDGFERFAQYELVVQIDGRAPTSAWRRYSAFRALVASIAAESAPRHIVRTLSAWADAQDAKRMFRCTHPAYLIQRYYHFEHILREALFELSNPHLLLAFFSPEDDEEEKMYNEPLSARSDSAIVTPSTTDHQKSPLDTAVGLTSSNSTPRLKRADDIFKDTHRRNQFSIPVLQQHITGGRHDIIQHPQYYDNRLEIFQIFDPPPIAVDVLVDNLRLIL
eukprot:CAMPEP_0197301652 /NCGR_PEP_ID=MMETSP0890-20130614/50535_1 /TAXON_ID=44058 ORGANISM="Aureoumbra lagunensis, Strain CCMP1510" /NCGR_SAMPLE_ID=MMETSP0890 /ASSEMBLY_ACC=CAM_ASM_000533 /LENGTH=607 /DNA_ID=CAMNT_0042781009 /DNA_START=93 /DNA_END=1917 /DNA_ORIENTATION=+